MERLTKRSFAGMAEYDFPESCFFPDGKGDPMAISSFCQSGLDRLAAYEDTGLMPEEIMAALAVNDTARTFVEKMADFGGAEAVKRLRELAEADKDGRVVVLPCKVGDAVYFAAWFGTAPHIVKRVVEPYFYTDDARGRGSTADFSLRDFGKVVFLTREEAEQALKEAKEDG